MSKPRSVARRVLLLLFLGCSLSTLTASIDETQFACEEALAEVSDCCGPSAAQFRCGAACDPTDVDFATADCLRNATCESMRSSGACSNPTGAVCQ